MNLLYAVPWIEVEYDWGSRDEGYRIYETLEDCVNDTKQKSEDGNYKSGNGYFGPVRPLRYYEIPDDYERPLPKFLDELKFKSNPIFITYEKN